ncbi:MAG: 2-hydroxyacyl-CoA dehydratase subunit D [Thermodesulfobacteriota bacterium]
MKKSIEGILKEFEKISSQSYREILTLIPKDRIPVGFFCPYVPVELIHAAGALPLRLIGPSIPLSHVHIHLPIHCCHLVKSSLEILLKGELESLRCIIFTHTCDSMQGISEIWAFQKKSPLPYHFMMPTHLEGEPSKSYLRSEIERLNDFINSEIGRVNSSLLNSSIKLFNRIRQRVRELYTLKYTFPFFSERNFAEVLRASDLMEPEYFLELIENLISHPKKQECKDRVPIFVSGNMIHHPSYFYLIEEAGAKVVWDNLCSGARFLKLMTREDIDPIEALTERYYSSFFCPTKHRDVKSPIQKLLEEVEISGARGVIFLFYKYCENHFFDFPALKEALESKAIPSLLLEIDDPSASLGQIKTRIQAFVEMLI